MQRTVIIFADAISDPQYFCAVKKFVVGTIRYRTGPVSGLDIEGRITIPLSFGSRYARARQVHYRVYDYTTRRVEFRGIFFFFFCFEGEVIPEKVSFYPKTRR